MSLASWQQRLQRLPARGRTVLVSCAYGLVAGVAAVAFQFGINWVYQLGLVRLSHQTTLIFLIGSRMAPQFAERIAGAVHPGLQEFRA